MQPLAFGQHRLIAHCVDDPYVSDCTLRHSSYHIQYANPKTMSRFALFPKDLRTKLHSLTVFYKDSYEGIQKQPFSSPRHNNNSRVQGTESSVDTGKGYTNEQRAQKSNSYVITRLWWETKTRYLLVAETKHKAPFKKGKSPATLAPSEF